METVWITEDGRGGYVESSVPVEGDGNLFALTFGTSEPWKQYVGTRGTLRKYAEYRMGLKAKKQPRRLTYLQYNALWVLEYALRDRENRPTEESLRVQSYRDEREYDPDLLMAYEDFTGRFSPSDEDWDRALKYLNRLKGVYGEWQWDVSLRGRIGRGPSFSE